MPAITVEKAFVPDSKHSVAVFLLPVAEYVVADYMFQWGNACYHYTLPNDTNTTRVSVDFRVIPRAYYQTIYKDCLRVDGQPRFSLGAYYQETGPISTDVAESAD